MNDTNSMMIIYMKTTMTHRLEILGQFVAVYGGVFSKGVHSPVRFTGTIAGNVRLN